MRRLIPLMCIICILIQTVLLARSNQVRAGMLKTMREQDSALKQAIRAMDMQSRAIEFQTRVIKQLRSECGTTQNRVAYQ